MMLGVSFRAAVGLETHEPLYKRVPTRDENNRPYSDFMMLIPRLRELPRSQLTYRIACLQAVLNESREVVFADLNVPINLLWVSVKPYPGIIMQIAGAIRYRLPEALLVGPDTHR